MSEGASVLFGLTMFGAVMATQFVVWSDNSLLVIGGFVFWIIAGVVAVRMSVVKRKPRWAFGGVLFPLVPVLYFVAESGPRLALAAVVVAVAVSTIVSWLLSFRDIGRLRELDKLLYSKSASVAFVVTMLGAVVYTFLESLFGLPRLRMFWVLGFGSWAQVVASAILKLRYR